MMLSMFKGNIEYQCYSVFILSQKKENNFQGMDLNFNVLIFTKDELLSVRYYRHIIDTVDLK